MLSSVVQVLALAASAAALPTITTNGAKFFTSNGNQWFIKGVAYQLTTGDPLANAGQCQMDASLMKQLGANAIRVYHVDAGANHDACMSAFEDAGIYVFLDLDTFSTYILPDQGTPSWTSSMASAYAAVMDAFQKYDNVAGFFVGNEMLNIGANSPAAPYVKAAAHDMKAYRDQKGYRKIPIGYSATDSAELRPYLQNYLACGTDSSSTIDFFGLNAYEWCGDSTYSTSGYANLESMAENYSIPIFFSETGCNTVPPRTFTDQAAIFGPNMVDTWSGAIIYEWLQEANNYGLVYYGSAPITSGNIQVSGTPTPITPDFANLSNQWKTLNPTGVSSAAYTPSLSPPACPSSVAPNWSINGNVPLPTLGQGFSAASVSATSTAGQAVQTSAAGSTSGTFHGSSTTTKGSSSGHTTTTTSTGGTVTGQSSAASSTTGGSSASHIAVAGGNLFAGVLFSLAALSIAGVALF